MDSFHYFTFYEVEIKIENTNIHDDRQFARAIGMFSLLEKNLGHGFLVGWCNTNEPSGIVEPKESPD